MNELDGGGHGMTTTQRARRSAVSEVTGAPDEFEGIPIVDRGGSGHEWLYRLYGKEGLLYVGITRTGCKRLEGHKRDKPWWPSVERIEVERFWTRRDVRVAECNAIADERPALNVADKGAYAAMAAFHAEERRRLLDALNEQRHLASAAQEQVRAIHNSRLMIDRLTSELRRIAEEVALLRRDMGGC